jgi:uncharacterized protein involved in outer membrane biogenesis
MPEPPRRPSWPKLLLSGLGGIGLLLGIVYVVLNHVFPPERLSALLSAQVKAATGRDFAVRGKLSIRLLPRIGVAAEDVVLGNAPWGTRKDMLVVRRARFDVAFWPLLQGQADIASVSFDGVDLLLETDRKGVGNWDMGGATDAAPTPDGGRASPLRLHLSQLRLSDVRLTYRDGRSGKSRSVVLQELALEVEGDGHRLQAALDSSGQRWQLTGRIGSVADLASNQADWPFDLQLASDGATLAAKGLLRRGALPRAVQADVSARLTRVQALTPWVADASVVPLPIELKARLAYAPSSVRIDDLQMEVAQQHLSGQLHAQGGTPWKVDAQLSSPSIDLARWLPPRAAAGAASAPSGERRWVIGTTKLPLGALPQGPATLALHVDRLLLPGLPPLSGVNAQFNAQPGRFKAEPLAFGIAGGTLRGSVTVASAGSAAPRVAMQVQGSDLSLDPLLQASGHAGFASGGKLRLRADLNMIGSSPRALAAQATGELLVSLSDARLGGGASPLGTKLLPRVLQAVTLQPRPDAQTRIECAVLRLPLKNGVAMVDRSIAIETDLVAITAKGEVRFGDETLTLAFRPTPKAALKYNPVDLAKLVSLNGPWLDPKLGLDAQGVLDMAATLGSADAGSGLSQLAQQLLRGSAQTDVCRAAMTGVDTGPAPPPPRSAASAPPSLPQALPEALRRLFKKK